jgi:hypothetical protein
MGAWRAHRLNPGPNPAGTKPEPDSPTDASVGWSIRNSHSQHTSQTAFPSRLRCATIRRTQSRTNLSSDSTKCPAPLAPPANNQLSPTFGLRRRPQDNTTLGKPTSTTAPPTSETLKEQRSHNSPAKQSRTRKREDTESGRKGQRSAHVAAESGADGCNAFRWSTTDSNAARPLPMRAYFPRFRSVISANVRRFRQDRCAHGAQPAVRSSAPFHRDTARSARRIWGALRRRESPGSSPGGA